MINLNRTIAPNYVEIEEIFIKKAESSALNNGIPLHILNAGEQNILKIDFVYNAGTWFDSKKGVSHATLNMLRQGTKSFSSTQIAELADFYGAFFEYSHASDRVNVSVYILSKYLKELKILIKELLFEPTFPQHELDILKNKLLQSLKVNQEKTSFVAGRKFSATLFPNHPYGKNTEAIDLEAITVDDLKTFFNKFYTLNNLEIFVSGKVTTTTISDLNDIVGNVAFSKEKIQLPTYTVAEIVSEKVTITKENALQTTLRIGKKLFNRTHPDYLKFLVANEIFGGYFGSRLMKNIREDKGYTYGIYSSVGALKHEGYFVIAADVKKEFADEAVKEIMHELTVLITQPVNEEELERVKKYMLGSFMNQLNTPFELMDRFKSIHNAGLDYSYYDNYIETIKNISAKEIQEIATKYMNPETLNVIKVG